ncbi:hypothetical protein A8U91_01225 [Halomonas elongata]|uniref:Uncharacterized protein n=1 Tax=Halomonas elongata TaxID=2746 RepID=A0A1B8P3R3_HALEL|nr:hypothetical protein A8U91_01225 [Halomonas elongata]
MYAMMPPLPSAAMSLLDPFGFGRAACDYWGDALERGTLYLDVMRQRGNQYLEHIEKTKPNVLGFEAEVLLDGRDLPRPVNYELLRILPPEGVETDPDSRPFVVIDPRAGHGPGSAVSNRTARWVWRCGPGIHATSSGFCRTPCRARRSRTWSRRRSPFYAMSLRVTPRHPRNPWWWATARPAGRS